MEGERRGEQHGDEVGEGQGPAVMPLGKVGRGIGKLLVQGVVAQPSVEVWHAEVGSAEAGLDEQPGRLGPAIEG